MDYDDIGSLEVKSLEVYEAFFDLVLVCSGLKLFES